MKNVLEFPMEKTNYRNCKIKKIGEGSEKGLTEYHCTYGKKNISYRGVLSRGIARFY